MTLSTLSTPSISSCAPGNASVPLNWRCKDGAKILDTREDLPEPETPVTAVKHPNGNSTSMLARLFCLAPITLRWPFVGVVLSSGTGIERLPERYAPVIESLALITCFGVPFATIWPPSNPAPGPRSQSQSACLNVSSSCSTTKRVLPRSDNSLRVANSLALSL